MSRPQLRRAHSFPPTTRPHYPPSTWHEIINHLSLILDALNQQSHDRRDQKRSYIRACRAIANGSTQTVNAEDVAWGGRAHDFELFAMLRKAEFVLPEMRKVVVEIVNTMLDEMGERGHLTTEVRKAVEALVKIKQKALVGW